jgi:hypothetical protein
MKIDGMCGDGTCEARVTALLLLPNDKEVCPPCDQCAAAATATLAAKQEAWLRAARGPGR